MGAFLSEFRSAKTASARIVLCAGLKSSGSTWLYNAVTQLLEASGVSGTGATLPILPFYADKISKFPVEAERSSVLVIKTHRPSDALEFAAHSAHARVLITVREPRDAIASLMQRFSHRFEPCLKEVSTNAARLVDLFRNEEGAVLRYEDRFYERSETLESLAHRLDLRVSKTELRRIFSSLTATNVEERISALSKMGAFGTCPTPDSFDTRTQWHPGHIGDRRIGKYGAVLTPSRQQRVLRAMRDYCAVFGYEMRSRAGVDRLR